MSVKIENINGVNCISVDGKIIDPLAFKSFRPTKKNVKEFYDAGVRLFHVYCSGLMSGLKVPYSLFGETWFGDKEYDFTNLDKQIDFFAECAPDAYVFVNIHLDSREWWLKNHPGSVNSFTHLSQIAADEAWRRDTADYLKALIRHTEEKYPDFVCGYFLLGGFTTEWFSHYDHEATHPTKLKAYREYLNDPDALIPDEAELIKPANQIYLDPEKDAKVITYRHFHNELIADTVLYYCHAAQEVLDHKKPVGVFFGYILELLDERMWEAGHIEFDRINRSPDIDILATPSSYQFRSYDDASAYMLLCDTLSMNNKMCWISFDHTTYLVPTLPQNTERVCGDPDTDIALKTLAEMRASNPRDLLKTKEQTLHAMRREFMQRITKRTGLWWFDMLEGWFYDPDLMAEIRHHIEISKRLMNVNKSSCSEIAVFISGESLYEVNKCSKLNTELIANQRDALSRMGAPYDIYSLNDLERIDKTRYKLIIFINAFRLSDTQLQFIDTLKHDGRHFLFIGGAGYVTHGGLSLERVERLIGMKLEPCELDEKEIRAFDSVYGYSEAKKPLWYVNDANCIPLGRYAVSRKVALAEKKHDDYTVYFSGMGNISHRVLNKLAENAGVHIYTKHGVPIFASTDIVGVYNTSAEHTELAFRENGEYEELFSGKHYTVTDKKLTLETGASPAQMLIKIR